MFAASKVAGASAAAAATYVEDVFSTYLYAGTGNSQPISNGIDLSTKGGLVWLKGRTNSGYSNVLSDTARGISNALISDSTNAQYSNPTGITALSTTGFTLGTASGTNGTIGGNYSSWTFRKQPKFFDVVTYTGTGVNRTVSHNLGSVPGCIIVKRTDTTGAWQVYHRSLPNTDYLVLNTNANANTGTTRWNSTTPTSTVFSLGTDATVNASGGTYVAYLFAHDAGGFGVNGTDNVISCGSFSINGSGAGTFSLGWEPQFIIAKRTSGAGAQWFLVDNMRGLLAEGATPTSSRVLEPNTTNAELNATSDGGVCINTTSSTGQMAYFDGALASGLGIYIAIRKGPSKVPTDATKVFQPVAYTGTNVDNRLVNTGIVTDMTMARIRASSSTGGFYTADRLRGDYFVATATTAVEAIDADSFMTPTVGNSFSTMNGFGVGNDATRQLNQSSTAQLAYAFKRAPGFFDEVCYTGTGSATTFSHNLGVAPELMIVKRRSGATANWPVYSASEGNTKAAFLNSTNVPSISLTYWNGTSPTSTSFSVSTNATVNSSNSAYVAYLFATCPGVSKVGSYTGTGTLTTINCGFAGGARFVLIKRTDVSAYWYVWDTARGMVAGTDPWLLVNTADVENNADNVYTTTGGFQLVASPSADVNTSGGTYIYLAIA